MGTPNPYASTYNGPFYMYVYGGTSFTVPASNWTPWSEDVPAGQTINQIEAIGCGSLTENDSLTPTTYDGLGGGGYAAQYNETWPAGLTITIGDFALPDEGEVGAGGDGIYCNWSSSYPSQSDQDGGFRFSCSAAGGAAYSGYFSDLNYMGTATVTDFFAGGVYSMGGPGAAGQHGRGGAFIESYSFPEDFVGVGYAIYPYGLAYGSTVNGGNGDIAGFGNDDGGTVGHTDNYPPPTNNGLPFYGGIGGQGNAGPTSGVGTYATAGQNGYNLDTLHGSGGGGGRANMTAGTGHGGNGGYWGGCAGAGKTANGTSGPGVIRITYGMIENYSYVVEPFIPQLPAPPYTPPAPEAVPGIIYLKAQGTLTNPWNGLPDNPTAQQPQVQTWPALTGITGSEDEEV